MTLTSFFLWGAAAYALLLNWNALTERINADMQLLTDVGQPFPTMSSI
jgi:hypothetical protein